MQHPEALIAFAIYCVVLVIIIINSGRIMQKTEIGKYVEEFYTAGRGLGAVVLAFMISAGLCSAGTFLGGAGLTWQLGLGFSLIGMAQIFLNFYILGGFAKKVGIVARRVNAQSFVDILASRYENNKVVIIASAIAIVIFLGAYASSQFVGGARVLEVMTGLPYTYGLLIYGVLVILYTTFGGLRGAAMATLFQGVVMTIATLLLVVSGIGAAGGVEAMYKSIAAQQPAWITPMGMGLSFKYIFSLWIAFGFGVVAIPHGLVGVLTYKNWKAARGAIILGAIVTFIWTVGLALASHAGKVVNPDLPIPDHNLPILAFKSLNPALAGVLLAGITGAIQSTVGVLLIVISSTLVRNVYQAYINPKASPQLMKKVTRVCTAIIGCVVFVLAFSAPPALQWIIIFAVSGCVSAFLVPVLGFYWPRANQFGAAAALVGGFITVIVAKVAVPSLAMGMDPVIVALIVSAALMVSVSLLTKKPSRETIELFWGKYKPSSL